MHEASLVEGLLKTVLDSAASYEAQHPDKPSLRIRKIRCELGLLAAIEEETLKACFEVFAQNTNAEGAEIVLETKPLVCTCQDCGLDFRLKKRKFACPVCKSENIRFGNASGLTITAINVDCEDKNG